MKKVLSILMGAIIMASTCAFSACAVKPDNVGGGNTDASGKTQITVAMYEGGYGTNWMDKAIAYFEEKYKDTEIEPGKKGLDIHVRPDKTNYTGAAVAQSYAAWDRDIYVTDKFVQYNELAKKGLFLELTDIVTEKYDNGRSIADKMEVGHNNWFNIDGKYYGLPHAEGGCMISYNVDVFEKNLCYFKEDGSFVTSLDDEFSTGPDGKPNTYDDGLPRTYEEFFKVCDRFIGNDVTPVIWSGELIVYVVGAMISMFADYEGYEGAMKHFTFNGEMDIISSFDENGNPVITKEPVTAENGYKVYQQPGMYNVLSFFERLIDNENYYDPSICFGSGTDHLGAQRRFIRSSLDENDAIKTAAMFVEGNWWYNEAEAARTEFIEYYGVTEDEMRYAKMPFPKASMDKLGDQTMMDSNQSCVFVNKNVASAKIPYIKEFIQYCYTDEYLSHITSLNSVTLPFDYEVLDEDYEKLTYFGKSLVDCKSNTKYLYGLNQEDITIANPTIMESTRFWNTSGGYNPLSAFRNSNTSARQWYDSILDYYDATYWASLTK